MHEQEQTIELTEGFSVGQPQGGVNQESEWQRLKRDPHDIIMSTFAVAVQIFAGVVFFAGLVAFVALLAILIIARTRGG